MQNTPAADLPPARPRPIVIGLALALLIGVIGIAVNYSRTQTLNVPWYDDWDALAPTAIQITEGTFQPSLLVQQHIGSRLATSRAIVIALTAINGWYGPSEVVAVYIGIFGALIAAFILLRREGQPYIWFLLPLIGAVVFTLRQNMTLYNGIQTQWTWANALSLIALLAIARGRGRWLNLIVAAGLVAWGSYTNLHVFAMWGLLLPALWWFGWRKVLHYAVWFGVAGVVALMYLNGYTRSGFFETQPVSPTVFDYLKYVLVWIGGPITVTDSPDWVTTSLIFSGVWFALMLANLLYLWVVRRERGYALIWGIVAAYAVIAGVLASIARINLMIVGTPAQPMSARYIPGSMWAWVALAAVGAVVVQAVARKGTPTRRETGLAYANLITFAAMIGIIAAANAYQNAAPRMISAVQYDCVRNFPIDRQIDCLENIYPDWHNNRIHNTLGDLARLRLNTFIDWQPPVEAISPDPLKAKLIAYRSPAYETVNLTDYLIGGQLEPVIYQAPNGLLEQWISVPEGVQSAVYEAAIWVDPNNPVQDTVFRLYVAAVGSDTRERVFQGRYDIDKESAPRPFRVNLSAWRGQTVRLIYETALTDPAVPTPWAMWVNPRLTTRP